MTELRKNESALNHVRNFIGMNTKLGKNESALNYVRTLIVMNTKVAFESEYFTKIGQDTLIDILHLEFLIIDEIDVLIACSKWVDAKVDRQTLEPTPYLG